MAFGFAFLALSNYVLGKGPLCPWVVFVRLKCPLEAEIISCYIKHLCPGVGVGVYVVLCVWRCICVVCGIGGGVYVSVWSVCVGVHLYLVCGVMCGMVCGVCK